MIYKISFYAPIDQVDTIKNAMFAAGAGKLGNYSHCAWQVLGEGQYQPLEGSTPYQGSTHHIEKALEYKVEMICHADYIHDVMKAFRKVHPYEEPAYQVIRVEDF